MNCPQCKKNKADIHFDRLLGGQSIKLDLCEDCAKKSTLGLTYVFPSSSKPALNDLMDLLSQWHTKSPSKSTVKSACPACGWTMENFQKSGKMGCSECYLHFIDETESSLNKIHGHKVHKGKKAPGEVVKTKSRERNKSIERLKIDLDKAVKAEEYELAATLRDKIKALEKN